MSMRASSVEGWKSQTFNERYSKWVKTLSSWHGLGFCKVESSFGLAINIMVFHQGHCPGRLHKLQNQCTSKLQDQLAFLPPKVGALSQFCGSVWWVFSSGLAQWGVDGPVCLTHMPVVGSVSAGTTDRTWPCAFQPPVGQSGFRMMVNTGFPKASREREQVPLLEHFPSLPLPPLC